MKGISYFCLAQKLTGIGLLNEVVDPAEKELGFHELAASRALEFESNATTAEQQTERPREKTEGGACAVKENSLLSSGCVDSQQQQQSSSAVSPRSQGRPALSFALLGASSSELRFVAPFDASLPDLQLCWNPEPSSRANLLDYKVVMGRVTFRRSVVLKELYRVSAPAEAGEDARGSLVVSVGATVEDGSMLSSTRMYLKRASLSAEEALVEGTACDFRYDSLAQSFEDAVVPSHLRRDGEDALLASYVLEAPLVPSTICWVLFYSTDTGDKEACDS